MDNYYLIKFILDRKYDELIQLNIFNFETIGFEVDDPIEKMEILKELPEWDIAEFDIKDENNISYGVYFEDSEKGLKEISKFLDFMNQNIEDFEYEKELIDNSNWEEEWKKSYKSFEIGKSILVKPSWEESRDTDRIIIEIDPKMAFGTGTHETTSMCMEYVEQMDMKDRDILDIGCGSGILSILSKKLNAKNVDACDIDQIAVDSTIENSNINNVEVNAFISDLFSNVEKKYDIIFANILAEILVKMLSETNEYLKEKGILILSGIIREKENLVLQALEENDFELIDKVYKNDWVLLSARRKNV
ncbi:50S ribosomal protein L11 methyltransferase [Helcococcus sueciensis]|uniref:50S ribosomal protein L11 methyltransferase n=1 Tax=Helcococcus sueciensis TaxID=241555 RepID=UPI000422E9C7|nr:50S ribosomal protein L11 methyltransferase [Helcococcus sueciensis]